MNTFSCVSKDQFLKTYEAIADHVVAHGYALIDAWDVEAATLREISEHFGRVQSHIRADANGVVGISTEAAVNREWESFPSEYIGVSAEEFLPHTDGSYLHGLTRQDDDYIELFPPKMLILQCCQNAAVGGGNVLIDGQRVYQDLAREKPHYLDALSRKGCVTYCRDDQIALDCAVFETLDDGAIMLRLRYDAAAYVADWALDAFHAVQKDYFANPRYQRQLKLTRGQILIIDNYRMLHGRASFASGPAEQGRCLHRIWLARDHLPVLCNAVDEHREKRALKPFKAYGVLPVSHAYAAVSSLPLGIRSSASPQIAQRRQAQQPAHMLAQYLAMNQASRPDVICSTAA
jgi:alpha-ketoglutarate-dependent taurine dioxygenase